jgi:hypothetical protein
MEMNGEVVREWSGGEHLTHLTFFFLMMMERRRAPPSPRLTWLEWKVL